MLLRVELESERKTRKATPTKEEKRAYHTREEATERKINKRRGEEVKEKRNDE